MCQNWFHIRCVNISEAAAESMNEYICAECSACRQENEEDLYCLCRQPYDETQ